LQRGNRGFCDLRGFCEGLSQTLARALSLMRFGFFRSCEGCEGFARAYTCERGGAARAAVHASLLDQAARAVKILASTGKPSQPSHFQINRLKENNKNPRIHFSQPSKNPRNPRKAFDPGWLESG
jgi:hypothetical protein